MTREECEWLPSTSFKADENCFACMASSSSEASGGSSSSGRSERSGSSISYDLNYGACCPMPGSVILACAQGVQSQCENQWYGEFMPGGMCPSACGGGDSSSSKEKGACCIEEYCFSNKTEETCKGTYYSGLKCNQVTCGQSSSDDPQDDFGVCCGGIASPPTACMYHMTNLAYHCNEAGGLPMQGEVSCTPNPCKGQSSSDDPCADGSCDEIVACCGESRNDCENIPLLNCATDYMPQGQCHRCTYAHQSSSAESSDDPIYVSCCLWDDCYDNTEVDECEDFGGEPLFENFLCSYDPCDATSSSSAGTPKGACCAYDNSCITNTTTEDTCYYSLGGAWFYEGLICAQAGCSTQTSSAPIRGACCSAVDFSCAGNNVTEAVCDLTPGGGYFYEGETCTEVGCGGAQSSESTGELCCRANGFWCSEVNRGTCSQYGSDAYVVSDCDECTGQTSSAPEQGACCGKEGASCLSDNTTESACYDILGGEGFYGNQTCAQAGCDGAQSSESMLELCCYYDGQQCSEMSLGACDQFGDDAYVVTNCNECTPHESSSSSSSASGVCCNSLLGGACSFSLGPFWCGVTFGSYVPNGNCADCAPQTRSAICCSQSTNGQGAPSDSCTTVTLTNDETCADAGYTGNEFSTVQQCTNACIRGACCSDTTCIPNVAKNSCQGTFKGSSTTCSPENPCLPKGACCENGVCKSDKTAQSCKGTFQGAGSTCSPDPCATGACCIGSLCAANETAQSCQGTFKGVGSTCSPENPCLEKGACCNEENGQCSENANRDTCTDDFYQYSGDFTSCADTPCGKTAACCTKNGACFDLSAGVCRTYSGTPHANQSCNDEEFNCGTEPQQTSSEGKPFVCCESTSLAPQPTCRLITDKNQCAASPVGSILENHFSCAPNPCTAPVTCCYKKSRACIENQSRAGCEAAGGKPLPDAIKTCDNDPCEFEEDSSSSTSACELGCYEATSGNECGSYEPKEMSGGKICCCPKQKQCCREVLSQWGTGSPPLYRYDWMCTFEGPVLCGERQVDSDRVLEPGTLMDGCAERCNCDKLPCGVVEDWGACCDPVKKFAWTCVDLNVSHSTTNPNERPAGLCASYGGTFVKQTSCSDDPCDNVRACCTPNGCKLLPKSTCKTQGGEYLENERTCKDSLCKRACCSAKEAICSAVTKEQCGNGEFRFDLKECKDDTCNRACCTTNGTCTLTSKQSCEKDKGTFKPDTKACSIEGPDAACPLGICCYYYSGLGAGIRCDEQGGSPPLFSQGMTEQQCKSFYKGKQPKWVSGITSCESVNGQNPCLDPSGACCMGTEEQKNLSCLSVTADKCKEFKGDFKGVAAACSQCPSEKPACCTWDTKTKTSSCTEAEKDGACQTGKAMKRGECLKDGCPEEEKKLACCPKASNSQCAVNMSRSDCDPDKPISDENSCEEIDCAAAPEKKAACCVPGNPTDTCEELTTKACEKKSGTPLPAVEACTPDLCTPKTEETKHPCCPRDGSDCVMTAACNGFVPEGASCDGIQCTVAPPSSAAQEQESSAAEFSSVPAEAPESSAGTEEQKSSATHEAQKESSSAAQENSSDGTESSAAASSARAASADSSESSDARLHPAAQKGNCCVRGKDFGICYARMEYSTCVEGVAAGIFLGNTPCIESPSPTANCTPTEESSSSSESSAETSCGNGEVDAKEECDEGEDNSDAPNAMCREDCTFSRCGDGIVDSSPSGRARELCDDGELNSNTGTALCRTNCRTRNSFFTIGEWLQSLQLYAIEGTPVPNAPVRLTSMRFITLGILTFLLL